MTKTFFISTAIDYPSGRFHLGHAYEKVCADVLARWKRTNEFNVHFSTGTDCHGLKIERAAEKSGKSPLDFITEISKGFKDLCKTLNISYDDFIMTIEPRHKKVAQYIIQKIYDNGDIYKGSYEGPYCVDCETYYTKKDLINGNCPVHKRPVEKIKEESYFFRLSKYQKFLIKYISKNPDCIWPEKKRKEILNRLKEPLKDLSISRKNVKWGIPLPFDKNVTEFVWIEALNNYLTTIDYPDKRYKDFWPAVHFIGSDIVWHHTTIWFSLLESLNLEIPKVIVHGFITTRGEKLSKAANLRVDPIELAEKYSADGLRYFLIREIPFGQDGDFSEESLKNRINNELANELGNLVNRTLTISKKLKEIKKYPIEIKFDIEKIEALMEEYRITEALNEIWRYVQKTNRYINQKEPWKLQDKELETILYNCLESIRKISILLWPFIPETCERIQSLLNIKSQNLKTFDKEIKFYNPKEPEILFKKIN